ADVADSKGVRRGSSRVTAMMTTSAPPIHDRIGNERLGCLERAVRDVALGCSAAVRRTLMPRGFSAEVSISNEINSPTQGAGPPRGNAEIWMNNSESLPAGRTKPKPRASFQLTTVP